jgi:tellurite methyltransferase
MTHSPWAHAYSHTPDSYVWGTAPSTFARRIAPLVERGGRVLELGCGEGRDSVFFASRGFDVTAIELSAAGLRKAARLADAHGVRVRWLRGDMARRRPAGPFALVYSCGSVHYVERRRRHRLFERLAAHTRPGGYHAHIVFSTQLVYVERREVIDYFAPGEIAALYAGWRILHHAARTIVCAEDGTRHRHAVEELIARKPA